MSDGFTPGLLAPGSPSKAPIWFFCTPDEVLVRETAESADVPRGDGSAQLVPGGGPAHYLGALDGAPCLAVAVPRGSLPPQGFAFVGLRRLFGRFSDVWMGVAGRAMQIAAWDRDHAFCGRCASPTLLSTGERSRKCPRCELSFWPRVSPAVIVLVRRGRQALLARSARFPRPFFSTLAGFVEPGESLEETVARELREEVGVEVAGIRYFGSQPWPFPNSLMVGFVANHVAGELQPDGEEIAEAGWYDPELLPMIPPPFSIARQLIDAWVAEASQTPAPGS